MEWFQTVSQREKDNRGKQEYEIIYEKYCCIVPWDTVHAAKYKRTSFCLPENVISQSVLLQDHMTKEKKKEGWGEKQEKW